MSSSHKNFAHAIHDKKITCFQYNSKNNVEDDYHKSIVKNGGCDNNCMNAFVEAEPFRLQPK